MEAQAPIPDRNEEEQENQHKFSIIMPPFQASSTDQNGQSKLDHKNDLKERNRIAAQKWRKKKDEYLFELEDNNDKLREETFRLMNKVTELKAQGKVLEQELQFFQKYVTSLMMLPGN